MNKKFNSRNDPYQNALSDKTVLRTASEKRVASNIGDMGNASVFSKTFEKSYISKSIARNMSSENSSTGRRQNEKTFNFVSKPGNEIKDVEKYA